jgi:hypothetical protein
VASLNSDYLPTPRIWTEHIRTALDPWTNPNEFSGINQFPGWRPLPVHMLAFRSFLPAYRALALRYVLVPASEHFAPALRTPVSAEATDVVELAPGASLEATFPGASLVPGSIETVSVLIGTFQSTSNGALSLTACAGDVCQSGTSDLASATDNVPVELRLNGPLPIAKGQDLRLRFTHDGGTVKVAIWHYPQTSGTTRSPGLAISYSIAGLPLRRVYANRLMTIHQLRMAFRTFLPTDGDLALRYVFAPPWESFAPALRTPVSAEDAAVVGLAPGASLEATFPGASLNPGAIETVAVLIGTFPNTSNGALSLTACAGDVCQSGASDLASTADNAPVEIRLNGPLPIAEGQDLRLRFTHEGGTAEVAIWHYPQTSGTTPLPGLAISYSTAGLPLRRVYADRLMTIYELTNPAPYFEAVGGPCRVSAIARETVTTDCASPARLIRRELFFDGWRATVNGQRVPILPAAAIVQAVDIPSGAALIEFHYAPPYAAASAVAFVVALVILAAGTASRLPWKWRRWNAVTGSADQAGPTP